MPTEKCNFRCTYCYEDFRLGRMRPSVVRGIKALIDRRIGNLTQLHISWFGGEPTLALDIIEDINTFSRSRGNPDLSFSSSISTNASLLGPHPFSRLCDVDVRQYQISLDGSREQHNITRVFGNGDGTYDHIMWNIEAAAQTTYSFEMVFRLHAHQHNIASLERLIDVLEERFAHDERFKCFIKAVENLGQPSNKVDLLESKAIVTELNARLRRTGFFAKMAGTIGACYAAHANSFVIRSDGSVGKCTVALSDPKNTVGALQENGDLNIDRDKFLPWIRGALTGEMSALRCPLTGISSKMI
jgi:uncharacterized protein